MDGLLWVGGDEVDVSKLDEVILDDQHSVLSTAGFIVGGKYPIVTACKAISTSNNEVVAAGHCIAASYDDVIVLNQIIPHFLEQGNHINNLLVYAQGHSVSLAVLAHHIWSASVISIKSPDSLELEMGVTLFEKTESPKVTGPTRTNRFRFAIHIGIEGFFKVINCIVGVAEQLGIDVQPCKVVVSPGDDSQGQQEESKTHFGLFHLELITFSMQSDFDQNYNYLKLQASIFPHIFRLFYYWLLLKP